MEKMNRILTKEEIKSGYHEPFVLYKLIDIRDIIVMYEKHKMNNKNNNF